MKALAEGGPARSALVINYPDRYTPRRAPYPLGYWGVTLAPVRVTLGDFCRAEHGRRALTESWSAPALGPEAQHLGPYHVGHARRASR